MAQSGVGAPSPRLRLASTNTVPFPQGAYGLGMGRSQDEPALAQAARSPWHTWVNGRVSGNGGDDIKGTGGRFTWEHLMIASGADYRVSPGLIVGGFASYEDFEAKRTDVASKLSGHGRAIGAYGGWKILKSVVLQGGVAHTWLDYDARAGAVEGSFDGERWMLVSRLSGTEKFGRFLLTPQTEFKWLNERQDGYTASSGARVNAQHYVSGVFNGGMIIATPVPLSVDLALTPFAGVFADYRFGVEAKSSGTILGLGDGISARFRGGAMLSSTDAWSATIETDVGNVGGKGDQYYSGRLGGEVKF